MLRKLNQAYTTKRCQAEITTFKDKAYHIFLQIFMFVEQTTLKLDSFKQEESFC